MSASFVLEVKLHTTWHDEEELEKRFFVAFLMHNRLVNHANRKIRAFRQDKEARKLLARRKECQALLAEKKDTALLKHEISEINNQLKVIRENHDLSEKQFQSWLSVQQHKYKNYIDSDVSQKIASRVWAGAEKVLFGNGKQVNRKKLEDITSMEGKKNSSGIRFCTDHVEWFGLSMPIRVKEKDAYAKEALTRRVKYCRIVRKPMGRKYHYYLQLILEGIPPQKHKFLEDGDVGIDPGVSTEAVVSENGCILTELSSVKNRSKELCRTQRGMDRSRRATNKENYNGDGTIKTGKKTWVRSKNYNRLRMHVKTLYRKQADDLKQEQEKLANRILCEHGSDVKAEKMNYEALAKKAKPDENNRRKKRKRFGHSIETHAPAQFLAILNRKLGYIGKEIFFVDTWKFRASQYDHSRDRYKKASLNERWKNIRGKPVQRDLYSAFLLMNAKDETAPDREKCKKRYRRFHKMHDACIQAMKEAGISKPCVFGF